MWRSERRGYGAALELNGAVYQSGWRLIVFLGTKRLIIKV